MYAKLAKSARKVVESIDNLRDGPTLTWEELQELDELCIRAQKLMKEAETRARRNRHAVIDRRVLASMAVPERI
jgi:hypothetical protein